MWERAQGLIGDNRGAVAPTIALSLIALIAVGGVAFDYSRMASMDTELQNAADQAALAAASQLDGKAGACARAAAAARNMITNRTLMANEPASNTAIIIANEPGCDAAGNVRFYQNITKTTAATSDQNAKFVEIEVNPRTAYFALTPVVAAFSSGAITARAFASLGEAICRVPPLMMCNPNETGDPDFTVANYIGNGVRLVANDGGGNYGPGLFGFLEVGQGNGANALRTVLGRQGEPGDCSEGSGVEPNSGNIVSVRAALNTRFDMYDGGLNQACGSDGSLCPPSLNSRKDLLKGTGGGQNACSFQPGGGNVGWKVVADSMAYLPPSNAPLTNAQIANLAPMGLPRDICHAVSNLGSCAGGLIGDGVWDRLAYFRSNSLNYPEITDGGSMAAFFTARGLPASPSRYDIYKFEMANAATRLQTAPTPSPQRTAYGRPVCSPPGVTGTPDRRLLSVAVINCDEEDLSPSSTNVPVKKWIDIFLVEPTVARQRTENSDIYVEVVGETENADGNTFQVVKKSVPYLIE